MKLHELAPAAEAQQKPPRESAEARAPARAKHLREARRDRSPVRAAACVPVLRAARCLFARRLPKRGFTNIFAKEYATVNVSALEAFEDGTEITVEFLKEQGVIKKALDGLKVLGDGELTKKLSVKAVKFTKSAEEKIKNAGGTAEVID